MSRPHPKDDRNLPAVSGGGALVPTVEISKSLVSVEEITARRARVVDLMKALMKKGVHYGTIPGFASDKPTLLQPGAELLCVQFHLKPHYTREKVREFDPPYFECTSTCQLEHTPSGILVAEAGGLCNSREAKYRRKDPFDSANAIVKIADKRSLISGVRLALAVTDVFAVDLEDLAENERAAMAARAERQQPMNPQGPMTNEHLRLIGEALRGLDRFSAPEEKAVLLVELRGFFSSFLGRKIERNTEVTQAEAERMLLWLALVGALSTEQVALTDAQAMSRLNVTQHGHPGALAVDWLRETLRAVQAAPPAGDEPLAEDPGDSPDGAADAG
jgi:hypothetical protein